MKRKLKYAALGLGLFSFFLVITFPFDRLVTPLNRLSSQVLSQATGHSFECRMGIPQISWTLSVRSSSLRCEAPRMPDIEFRNLELRLLPWKHRLSLRQGEDAQLSASVWMRPWSPPRRTRLELDRFQAETLLPLVFGAIRMTGTPVAFDLEMQGRITGLVDLPLRDFERANGEVQLRFEDMKIPRQALLDLIGLQDLSVDPAVIHARIDRGHVSIEEVRLQSETAAIELEGGWQLTENLEESTGNLLFRWRIQESDATRRSFLGPLLRQNFCQSVDPQGFCQIRFARLSDFGL
ncbi:MAG: hypothetical protein EA369_02710 [Bradymonadales bacterium]|nr:MAG: hypothetical protein EA369_02710 [Bradymonadales bacterium]